MTTIECKEVCMSFGDQIVLDHISMRFENGHIYGITGRNGSGKTVLLKLICGLMTPTSGMILMNGKPVGASGTMHAEIGALIERPGFLGQYSGYKNLYLLAKLTCDYAAQQGIDPKTALTLFYQTMKGSADMLLNSGKDPQALMDMVTSKGGTTFALLNVLKEQGFNEAMISSFEACTHRAEELSI